MLQKIIRTDHSATTILIRLMVGAVFLSEGIQKFLFADTLGSGRFTKIGLPNPEFLGPFVGAFEIICGSLILLGLAYAPGRHSLAHYHVGGLCYYKICNPSQGWLFWEMMHGSRTDWAMLLGGIFLIIKGGGKWSLDHTLMKG